MAKDIDYRHRYVLVLDTETANTVTDENGKRDMGSALVYDCGWCIMDTKGKVYKERSYVNRDIFVYERKMMKSAYYADKIPQYTRELREGKRIMADGKFIRMAMMNDIRKYHISAVVAHNAQFDINALNQTVRWETKSAIRYWLPKGIEVWDTMMMARSVMLKMPTYKRFCNENGYVTKNGTPSATAENLYRFIAKDKTFAEKHTGLEDVRIEREIMLYCYKQHKPMKKIRYHKN